MTTVQDTKSSNETKMKLYLVTWNTHEKSVTHIFKTELTIYATSKKDAIEQIKQRVGMYNKIESSFKATKIPRPVASPITSAKL